MAYEFKNAVRYTLDAAYSRYSVPTDSYRIDITSASTVNASINVLLVLADGEKVRDLELKKGGFYESPVKIREIQITASVQSGEWVEIRETDTDNPPESPEYKRGVSDDSIGSIGQIDAPIVNKSGDTIDNDTVTVGTSVVQIVAANTARTRLTIQNLGANSIYIGGPSVTTANGVELIPNGVATIDSGAACYAISGVAGNDVRRLEERV